MKIKPLYIYIGIFIAVVVIIFFSLNNSDKPASETSAVQGNIPQDDIHKGLTNPSGGGAPSKDNVMENIKVEIASLKKAVEENPEDTVSIKKYADIMSAAHKSQEAINYYDMIIKKDPNRKDIRLGLTLCYYNMGEYDTAEKYTNKILLLDKNNHEAQYNLGAIAAVKGDTEKARKIWNELIKKYPNEKISQLAKQSLSQL